ncbi:Oidioi.mRNA.OKI2018_I69.chr2.g6021.t1.cds [Oikopleura dioica]|uniref:Oidioi.mRNA.OKI2018_I69.chr2.g6021.t1.cds n=1 Tax=Oikopleura dioica TaxID=34765 RepID=A0ABN7T3X8_OIKDI|nr:Oidioi.mRNA.OKI2018_I69.chr2.g6021.t1.cds [Oikopleura dioica]
MNKFAKLLLVIATTVGLQLSLLGALSTLSWGASNFLAFWVFLAVLAQVIKQTIGFEKCIEAVKSVYREDKAVENSKTKKEN